MSAGLALPHAIFVSGEFHLTTLGRILKLSVDLYHDALDTILSRVAQLGSFSFDIFPPTWTVLIGPLSREPPQVMECTPKKLLFGYCKRSGKDQVDKQS